MLITIYLVVFLFCSVAKSNRPTVAIISAKNKFNLVSNMLHTIFPKNDVIGPSLELALASCQENFKWDQWNCPSNDFLNRRSGHRLDREEAFITAINTAALMYIITKNCSNGELPGCGCSKTSNKNQFNKCSDETEFAENIIENFINKLASTFDHQGNANLHNIRVTRTVVKNSIRKYCRCKNILSTECLEETCWTSLKRFSDIAKELRQMYDRALLVQIDNSGTINWNKIPKNVLVFVHDSLNYCQINVIPGWKGMQGRQCSRQKDKSVTLQERRSCRHLCRTCGLRVKEEAVFVEKRCNCKFTWCCDVKCDICATVEKEYYCA